MEIGHVIEVKGDQVRLEMVRNAACDSCHACTIGTESKTLELSALNLCDAKTGDLVAVKLENKSFLTAVIIIYGIPLIALLVGMAAGIYIGKLYFLPLQELFAIGAGLVLMGLAFLGIRSQNKKFRREKYVPKAVRVISNAKK